MLEAKADKCHIMILLGGMPEPEFNVGNRKIVF